MPSGFGEEYNYSQDSSCESHPCIRYEFLNESSGSAVESGDFNGVDIDVNASKNRRGIRLFR